MCKERLKTLDFDAAVELARNDPDAFEQYRLDRIEALIARAPAGMQDNLRRFQWRIDRERQRAPNATAACVKLYQMMWDSFAGDNGLIDTLHSMQNPARSHDGSRSKAEVIDFPERGGRRRV